MTFFTPSLTFISGKNILSNLLIIILPCVVRILRQNIQKLATELHLAVLRNKKGGDAGSRHIAYWVRIWNSSTGILSLPGASVRHSAHDKGHEEGGSAYAKAGSSLRSPPGNSRASTPKPESAYFLLCAFTYTSDFTGGCLPLPLSGKRVSLQLQLIIPGCDSV